VGGGWLRQEIAQLRAGQSPLEFMSGTKSGGDRGGGECVVGAGELPLIYASLGQLLRCGFSYRLVLP